MSEERAPTPADDLEDFAPDWTTGEDGFSNSSDAFNDACERVERLIRGDAHMLIAGRADKTARLIMANLAHKHGFAPAETQ